MEAKRLHWFALVVALIWVTGGCASRPIDKQAQALFKAPEPYPDFITLAMPEPGAVYSLSAPTDHVSVHGTVDLCVTISIYYLIEVGDRLSRAENVEVLFDGQTVSDPPTHSVGGPILAVHGDDDYGSGISSDTVCWVVLDVPKGIHLAALRVWTTSGVEYSYSWAFRIVR